MRARLFGWRCSHAFFLNSNARPVRKPRGWWIESSNLDNGQVGSGEELARRVGARPAKLPGPLSRQGLLNAEQKFCNSVGELAIAASLKSAHPDGIGPSEQHQSLCLRLG